MNDVWTFAKKMAKIVAMAAVFSFAIGCLAGFATLVHHVVVELFLVEAGLPKDHGGTATVSGFIILIFTIMGIVMVIYAGDSAIRALSEKDDEG